MKGCLLACMILCFTGSGNNSNNGQNIQDNQILENTQNEQNYFESSGDVQILENNPNALSSEITVKESGEEIMEKVKQKIADRDKWRVDQVTTSNSEDYKFGATSSFSYIRGDDNDEKISMQNDVQYANMNVTTSMIKEGDYWYCLTSPSMEGQFLKFKTKSDSLKLKEILEKIQSSYYHDSIRNWEVEVEGNEYVLSGSIYYQQNGYSIIMNMTCKVASDYSILSSEVKKNNKLSNDVEQNIETKSTFSYDNVNVPKVENPSDYKCIN